MLKTMNCILFVPYQIRASPADSLSGATCSVLPTAGNGLGYRETQHRAGGPRRAAPGRSVPGFLDAHVGASCTRPAHRQPVRVWGPSQAPPGRSCRPARNTARGGGRGAACRRCSSAPERNVRVSQPNETPRRKEGTTNDGLGYTSTLEVNYSCNPALNCISSISFFLKPLRSLLQAIPVIAYLHFSSLGKLNHGVIW